MITLTRSDAFTYALAKKLVDLSADSVKVLLMRNGFVFNQAIHQKLINLKTNTGAIALTWAAADKSVSRGSGSFITDGFVPGNLCTSDDTNNPGPLTIATVTALKITFNETIVDSSATKTLTSNDELATGFGYTQNTKTTGTITVALNTLLHYTSCTFPTISWTASGGSIGPTPSAILFDDSDATTPKVIIGCIDFGGNQTVASTDTPNTFNIENGEIRLL